MPWDAAAAAKAAEQFEMGFKELKAKYPEAMAAFADLWKKTYLVAGHRIAGRIVLGQTAQQASRGREGKKEE